MAGSSYSVSLRFELQFTGENINLWGDKLNATFSRIDDSIAGYVPLTIPASGNYTLSSPNTNATEDEARQAHLKLTGSPTNPFSVVIPAVSKNYWIWNATAETATITTGSGGTAEVEAGDKIPVWSDGANVNDGLYYGGMPLKEYIAAAALGTVGDLPAQTGNAGKFVKTDGTNATWQFVVTSDLSDYQTAIVDAQIANAAAMAIVLGRRR